MAQPYVGEIRMFAGNFAPAGWMFCDGAQLPISEYETLFQLIGTTYGGDGQSTFDLPDLRGRIPVHQGNGLILAETAGVESVTLTTQQIPSHTHPIVGAATAGNQVSPSGNLSANSFSVKPYINEDQDGNFNAAAISPVGGSQPHTNFMPYLCIEFIISLYGIFPSPT
jgi:microcystin-dependent protein